MAPIPVQEIVKVSSESDNNPASNLLCDKKWLTCPNDKSQRVEIEFGFHKPVLIHYIDVGYFNVASMEVFIGSSSWPPSKSYAQLIPAVMMQNAIDARLGKNKTGCKMLNFSEHMCKEVGGKKWNRLRLILLQPHARNKQMGLEFIRFGTPRNAPVTPTSKQVKTFGRTSLSPASEKADSSFFRMMSRIKNSDEKVSNTTGKIKHFADPGNTLNRNVKMLIASKSSTPQPSSIHGSVEHKKDATKSTKPRKLFEKSSSLEMLDKLNDKDEEERRKKMSNGHLSENSCISKNTKPSEARVEKKDLISHQKKSITVNGNSTFQRTEKNQKSVTKIKTQIEENKPPDHVKVQQKDEVGKKENKIPSTSSDDCVIDASGKAQYTDTQVKQLKHAITRFFRSFNVDELDLTTLKVKDLRKKFESANKMKLNQEGRKYFRDATTENVHLIHAQQQNKTRPGKRKSSERQDVNGISESPQKLFRSEISSHMSVHKVQCPLCLKMFDGSVIEAHASVCLEQDTEEKETNFPRFQNNAVHNVSSLLPASVIDCSENSCLTPVEQLNWIKYSKEPKPYQERLNTSDFAGCKLVKCPSCGQKYKREEIHQHSDDCAEKVNSKCTKMGLYYIDSNETHSTQLAKQRNKFSSKTTEADKVIVID